MHLLEIFLPLTDNDGHPFNAGLYERIQSALTEHFGGVTAFTRSPAKGRFKEGGETMRDDIIILEVMAEILDQAWWATYRRELKAMFTQDEILIRATAVTKL